MSNTLHKIFAIIEDRKQNPKEGSYTNKLLDNGEGKILKKIGEEASEVIIATLSEGDERIISEMADLTYHCMVLLSLRGLSIEDVATELEARHVPDVN